MGTYSGIDLHSSNSYIGIIDEQDKICARHFVSGYQQKHVLLLGGGRVAEKAIYQVMRSRRKSLQHHLDHGGRLPGHLDRPVYSKREY